MTTIKTPVVIVGGGPVGMVLAMSLARLGVGSVVVNIETDSRWRPKGSTHNARTMETYRRQIGDFEIASLQVNFNDIALADAQSSMRLFGDKVLPRMPKL